MQIRRIVTYVKDKRKHTVQYDQERDPYVYECHLLQVRLTTHDSRREADCESLAAAGELFEGYKSG